MRSLFNLALSAMCSFSQVTAQATKGSLVPVKPILYSKSSTKLPPDFLKFVRIDQEPLPIKGLEDALPKQDFQNISIAGPVKDKFTEFRNLISEGDSVYWFFDSASVLPIPDELNSLHYRSFRRDSPTPPLSEDPFRKSISARQSKPPAPSSYPYIQDPVPHGPGRRGAQGLCLVRGKEVIAVLVTSTAFSGPLPNP